jgi:aconitate hydratase
MAENLARQLIAEHLIEGEMRPDAEIALKIDQFLLHDGTGPLCALQLEAMGVEQVCAETAVAYVDHLLVEADSKNADDHISLHSAARRFGMWFSRAGNGTSHLVHQQRFGIPGKTLLGADSHTPAAGGIGMLAIGRIFGQSRLSRCRGGCGDGCGLADRFGRLARHQPGFAPSARTA